ncbi:DMT family transporter [Bacillus oleivorans]|uniref:DMT family transporter n=1 Tax=Bacillus oleivorans TaxID=1448271 RepID=UPI000BE35418|nr:SMR family transporter [Bacillus oleivorans]
MESSVVYLLSCSFLRIERKSLKVSIPLGIGYAVWTSMGAAGSLVIGMLFFKEAKDIKRIFYLALIIVSVIGLRITSE